MYCCYNPCPYLFLWLIIKMTKKIWLFFFSFVAILLFWVSFADIIPDNAHYVDRCVKLQNVEIDNYRIIVENDTVTTRDVYEPQAGECLEQHYKFWESRQYLLDKSVDIEEITKENIQDKAIQIWNLKVNWWYVNNSNPLTNENFIYKIVKIWNDYTLEKSDDEGVENLESGTNYTLEIVESEEGIELVNDNRLIKFWIAWIITILIETIILFVIAKLFRKENQISNLRILFVWVLASTITLPLLRFVIPLFITGEVRYMIIWELIVTLIEIFIIKYWLKVSRIKAIIASILCNLWSYLFGLLVLW